MGPDGMSARVLKEGVESISYALAMIFNKSLTDSEVPLDWKLANHRVPENMFCEVGPEL